MWARSQVSHDSIKEKEELPGWGGSGHSHRQPSLGPMGQAELADTGPEPWQTLVKQHITVSLPSLGLLAGAGVAGDPGLTSARMFPFLRPLCERRKFLHDNMVEIPNRIMFSEMKRVSVSTDPTISSTPVFFWGLLMCMRGLLVSTSEGSLCLPVQLSGWGDPALQALCSSCAVRALPAGTALVCEREPPCPTPQRPLKHPRLSRLTVSPFAPQKASDLVDMINRVIREGLEGLVLKDAKVRQLLPLLSPIDGAHLLGHSSPGQKMAVAARGVRDGC